MTKLAGLLMAAAAVLCGEALKVKQAARDVAPSADPKSAFWRDVTPVFATADNLGKELPDNRTEIRVRWTERNFYVLMVCPYKEMYVLPNPKVKEETNKLWERDVAEVFLGADFEKIHQYKEYQLSPQGEWVDLDIDNKQPLPEGGWKWNSGMVTKARVDSAAKVWYGEFRIPLAGVTAKKVEAGLKLRGNFYRFQGGPNPRQMVAWRPTGRISNHTPEKFGELELVK